MGLIDNVMNDWDAAAFVDPDLTPGAEAVTVGVDGGDEWAVNAIVDRDPPVPADGRMAKPQLRITLRNHATLGIAVGSFNAGKYYVKVPDTVGSATPNTYRLHARPVSQDAGMLVFEV